ncbi:MAG: ATP-binding protein [Candidatus Korarchaeum sp.]|uniref:ATPase domain-containing protein n=1 Tax=Thermofilum adornatum 1505 TaxID=697581 RepID=A0A3G1A638_9CREN|nr:hypothetical protein TCARB_1306 [Thermofilum adornatum 1505]
MAVATTSEGLTRSEIGRHRWAYIAPLWNLSREGFMELYEQEKLGKGRLSSTPWFHGRRRMAYNGRKPLHDCEPR